MERQGKTTAKIESKWAARRFGYLIVIAILFAFLYVLENLYEWGIPFITEEYNGLLFYVRISFYASIIMHTIFLVYDPRWFRHLLKGLNNIFSTVATIMFYVVFPFDFPGTWNRIGKILLLVIMIISILSILIEFAKAIKYFFKEEK